MIEVQLFYIHTYIQMFDESEREDCYSGVAIEKIFTGIFKMLKILIFKPSQNI